MSESRLQVGVGRLVADHDMIRAIDRGIERELRQLGVDHQPKLRNDTGAAQRLALCVEVLECEPIGTILGGVVTKALDVGLRRLQHGPVVAACTRHQQLHLGDAACERILFVHLIRNKQHGLLPVNRLQCRAGNRTVAKAGDLPRRRSM